MNDMIPTERIENRVLVLRGKKVLLDRDLAELYGVNTKKLKQAVRRNIERFPEDFMFRLSKQEFADWRSQFVTSNLKMGLRYSPMAFTEQGIAMLSSVLRSRKAISMNIQIMRAFIKMREMLISNDKLAKKLEELEERIDQHDENSIVIMATLRKLISRPKEPKKRKIGFQGREEQS